MDLCQLNRWNLQPINLSMGAKLVSQAVEPPKQVIDGSVRMGRDDNDISDLPTRKNPGER
jgi:hypothetical protein